MKYKYYSSEKESLQLLVESASLNRYQEKNNLTVAQFDNGILVPRVGVYDEKGKFLPNSYWGGVVEAPSIYQGEPPIDSDTEVYYIGTFHSCWGHEITDGTRLLWGMIPELGGIALHSNVKFAYSLLDSTKRIPANFYKLLSYVGIAEDKLLRVDTPTRFKKLYLADECYFYDINTQEKRTYSATYQKFFDYLCRRIIADIDKPFRTVYFSRSGWKKGNPDFGEKEIENAFKEKMHCEIYRPEQLSFEEMVKLLQETKTFITTEGSISHNALFMQKGTEIVIIRKAGFISYYQLLINQIKDLNVTYIDAHRTHHFYNKETPYYGPFFLLKNKALEQYLGVKANFPICNYTHYRMHVLSRNIHNWIIRMLVSIKHALIK